MRKCSLQHKLMRFQSRSLLPNRIQRYYSNKTTTEPFQKQPIESSKAIHDNSLSEKFTVSIENEFVNENYKRSYVYNWLLLSSLGVLAMVLIGGYTRLTRSGLSMVKWKPVDLNLPTYTP